FDGDDFLMVYNQKRNGWEMPGGRIEENEDTMSAAIREYAEESGFDISVISVKEMNDCFVCAAILLAKTKEGEFECALFRELPEELAFERSEYDDVIEWARNAVKRNG
ncbi:MAG: NUDIX domain-containing protein, partial [Methanomassiliicoccaceae archaeon]|nr:NUDIX domain-containing protein [Methanomassiliicoccaceae archaeon]